MTTEDAIFVEVAYATPVRQMIIPCWLPKDSTIGQAIHHSNIVDYFPEIDLSVLQVGVWGVVRPLDYALASHDRVEIYRPLLIDPMEKRRQRAQSAKPKTRR